MWQERRRERDTKRTSNGSLDLSSAEERFVLSVSRTFAERTLHYFIQRSIKDEAEAIYTDELKSYIGIEDSDTRHETVNHSEEVWIVGDVHANCIEGEWSLLKRSIVGAFHKMSLKHMDRYLDEL